MTIKIKEEKIDSKLIAELIKITTKEERKKMRDLGFVCSNTDYPCNYVKAPYCSYEEYGENPDLKNNVQCSLHGNGCMNYSIKFIFRPCVVLGGME